MSLKLQDKLPKTIRLITFGIVFLGLVIFNYVGYRIHLGPSGHFIENISPGYPRISDIPLYGGDSSPNEIPNYENDVGITHVEPDG